MAEMNIFMTTGFAGSDRRERYSTKEHTELVSTTFTFSGTHYCVHCGEKAHAVQAGIRSHNCYDTTDFRCVCDGAMDEVAKLLAYEMGNFEQFDFVRKPQSRQPSSSILKMLISKVSRLSMNDLNANCEVYAGYASERFIHENSHEIKFNLHDAFYKDRPFTKFMNRVKDHYEGFQKVVDEKISEWQAQNRQDFRKVFDPEAAKASL